MRLGIAILALLLATVIPALFFAGATTLRGLGWVVVVAAGAVLLIDLCDRITEWVERRRWGRVARLRQDRLPLERSALRRGRARGVGQADVLQQQAHQPGPGDREELRGVEQ